MKIIWIITGWAAISWISPLRAETTDSSTADSSISVAYNIGFASQYVARGFRQTWGKPALQGGMDITLPQGFSLGTWVSTVSDKFIQDASIEWDIYGGWSKTVNDITFGTQIYYYYYPGAKLAYANVRYDYGEIVPQVSWRYFSAKYWYTYTRDYFGFNSDSLGIGQDQHSRGSGYLDLNANFDLGSDYALLLHAGRQRVANFATYNWHDFKISLSKKIDNGWLVSANLTKAKGKTDAYDNYTTMELFDGSTKNSNPLVTTFALVVVNNF